LKFFLLSYFVDTGEQTLLHIACLFKNYEIAELLLTFNADVSIPNQSGHTPLDYSILSRDLKLFKLLISYLKRTEATWPVAKKRALRLAVLESNEETVKLLNSEGNVNLTTVNNDGVEIYDKNTEFDAVLVCSMKFP
jgi:ankyrin repeat protein